MEELTLIVPSIGCQGCMKKIVTKLQSLPGIEIMQTDVPTKSLGLRYAREEISAEQIERSVQEIGHRVAPQGSVSPGNTQ
jgi:copper chaperone CopZ